MIKMVWKWNFIMKLFSNNLYCSSIILTFQSLKTGENRKIFRPARYRFFDTKKEQINWPTNSGQIKIVKNFFLVGFAIKKFYQKKILWSACLILLIRPKEDFRNKTDEKFSAWKDCFDVDYPLRWDRKFWST